MVRRGLRFPLILSIFIHLSFLLIWVCLFDQKKDIRKKNELTWIEVEPPKKEDRLVSNKKRRVVQTAIVEKSEKPKPDAFLGMQNQVVDRETVTKNKATVIGTSGQEKNQKNQKQQSSKSSNLSKLGLAILPSADRKATDDREWATPGLRPQDYVNGIKESDRTALNTKEYLYFGYFQRIRSRLDLAWGPILKERLTKYYNSGRHLASEMDHTTRVLVVLNDKGEIVRVRVLSESGTHDLDEAAVGAFNKAGPFPNPPQGMIDANREIEIPWDFILKT